MSNEVEALAVELREIEMKRQRERGDTIQSSDTPRTISADVISSNWLAEKLADARAEGYADGYSYGRSDS